MLIADDSLSRIILTAKDKSLIKPGDDYNLELLKNERDRIDALLKKQRVLLLQPPIICFLKPTLPT